MRHAWETPSGYASRRQMQNHSGKKLGMCFFRKAVWKKGKGDIRYTQGTRPLGVKKRWNFTEFLLWGMRIMSFHLPMESPVKPPFLIHAVGSWAFWEMLWENESDHMWPQGYRAIRRPPMESPFWAKLLWCDPGPNLQWARTRTWLNFYFKPHSTRQVVNMNMGLSRNFLHTSSVMWCQETWGGSILCLQQTPMQEWLRTPVSVSLMALP